MKRYIDVDDFLSFNGDYAVVEDYLRCHSCADVAAVKHGKWITDDDGIVICSECGEEHDWDDFRPPYCDICGAKMDGDRK